MKSFFHLNEYCQYVEGDNGILIYDLNNQKIYSFDMLNSKIIKMFYKGESLKDITGIYGVDVVNELIDKLQCKGLGEYTDTKFYIEPYRVGKIKKLQVEHTNILNTCFIELPCKCTVNCGLCNKSVYKSCETCSLPSKVSDTMDMGFYKSIIDTISPLNFNIIIFHGGDPLVLWSQLQELLEYTRANVADKTRIILKTNGALINLDISKFLIEYKVNPVIVFHFDKDFEMGINDKLSQLSTVIDFFVESKVNIFANILISRDYENRINEICKMLIDEKFSSVSISVIINDSHESQYIIDSRIDTRALLDFYHTKEYNLCLGGMVAISSDKKVLPCPSMKKHKIVDLTTCNLLNSFESNEGLDKFWKFTLDKISNCSNCKFRYSCVDCRAIEEELTGDLYGKALCECLPT
ncbi:4Fe-4S cluster-binding domain-containing protein [Clostridium sp. C8-1-8]|uniref:4Fe-4S cluster-binding domain-containing protein n=1 Tax=Clostridium sp. C8-1-8 TaxID=2698831 RepID=UPI0013681DC9|nr:4Fe-4S cluster-binding domain-containing protein [Clostridium sp. C8-1-8]